jgi:antitoxin component YwqK of YwqJK toxin-antitoxin module
MKKILLITLLLIVGCSKPVEESTLISKDGLMYLPDSDSPYSGEVFTNYDTGEKEYQGIYENGLLVEYSYLNKDGSVKEPINYETTLVERKSVYYTKDTNKPYSGPVFSLYEVGGQKKSEGNLKDGEKNGLWTFWNENGVRLGEGDVVNGLPHGISITYDANGLKIIEETFKYGVLHGHKTHFKNGFVEFVEIFENGNRIDVLNNYMSSIIEYKPKYIN